MYLRVTQRSKRSAVALAAYLRCRGWSARWEGKYGGEYIAETMGVARIWCRPKPPPPFFLLLLLLPLLLCIIYVLCEPVRRWTWYRTSDIPAQFAVLASKRWNLSNPKNLRLCWLSAWGLSLLLSLLEMLPPFWFRGEEEVSQQESYIRQTRGCTREGEKAQIESTSLTSTGTYMFTRAAHSKKGKVK